MIITDLSARNFLKYADLDLRGLPEQGIVAIDGPNESGKSSIGEAICFALFGRTFSLESKQLKKLIFWGEQHSSVSLKFKTADGEHYQISRQLDQDGNHGAQLAKTEDSDHPIARGIERVDETVYDLLGYGYEEFIESFYLAQREIIAPHPHSFAVKSMAGLSTLEYVSYEHAQEIEQEQQSIQALNKEIATVDHELDVLSIKEGELNQLESNSVALKEQEATLKSHQDNLEDRSRDYHASLPQLRSYRTSLKRLGFYQPFTLLLSAIFGGVWALYRYLPEHLYTQLIERLLASTVSYWSEAYLPWLLYASVGFLVIFVLFSIKVAGKQNRIDQLKKTGQQLADVLSQASGLGAESDPDVVKSDLSAHGQQESDAVVRSDGDELAPVCEGLLNETVSADQVVSKVSETLDRIGRSLQELQHQLVRTGQLLRQEKARLLEAERLYRIRDGFKIQVKQNEADIQLNTLALELLQGAMLTISQRFNRDLRDAVGRTLPLFTDNRYEHLQIEDDLTVRAFSTEKRDFMDLDEISSGTQRQIMLALRLALSEEMVKRTAGGRQFVFLDEPFAFFDQERTRRTLGMLPDLSQQLCQIWIVAQDFPSNHNAQLNIHCTREKPELAMVG